MASFTFKQTTSAPIETVFSVMTDHRHYPDYTPIRKAELEREGSPEPNGVGAIRKLTAVGPPLREEVLEYVAPTRFVYKLLSGAPLKDHIGTVALASNAGGGTDIVYSIDTTPTVPVVGGVVVAVVKQAVGGLLKGIVKESEKRAAAL